MDPAFVASSAFAGASTGGSGDAAAQGPPPLYFPVANCSALGEGDRSMLEQVGVVGVAWQGAVRIAVHYWLAGVIVEKGSFGES